MLRRIPLAGARVPATLQASLMARLDRLGAAKEVAQIGAAIGREFSYELLAPVAQQAGRGTGERRSTGSSMPACCFAAACRPHASYLFKHALVQDAAYGTLLRGPRRHCTRGSPKRSSPFPGDRRKPARAAGAALHRGRAHRKSGRALGQGRYGARPLGAGRGRRTDIRALRQIATLPFMLIATSRADQTAGRTRKRADPTKGHALARNEGLVRASPFLITRGSARRAPEDPLILFAVLYGFWVANRMAFNGPVVCELAEQFQTLAQETDRNSAGHDSAHAYGHFPHARGRSADGRAHLDRVIELYDPVEHRALATRFGHDVRMTAFCWRSLALCALGDPYAAKADTASALKDAREVGQAGTSMFALSHSAVTLIRCGEHMHRKLCLPTN